MLIKENNILALEDCFKLDLNKGCYLSLKTNRPIRSMHCSKEKMKSSLERSDNKNKNTIESIFYELVHMSLAHKSLDYFDNEFITKAKLLDRFLCIPNIKYSNNFIHSIISVNFMEENYSIIDKYFKKIIEFLKEDDNVTIHYLINFFSEQDEMKKYKISQDDYNFYKTANQYCPFRLTKEKRDIFFNYSYFCYKKGYHLSFTNLGKFFQFFLDIFYTAQDNELFYLLEKKNIFLVASTIFIKAKEKENEAFIKKYKDEYKFEDEKFCVIFPSEPVDLAIEGQRQHNCVGTYIKKVLEDRTLVVFVRKKKSPDKSYITCDFSPKTGEIFQFLLSCNQYPTPDSEEICFKKKYQEYLYSIFQNNI